MQINVDDGGVRVQLDAGGELWVAAYNGTLIDGLAGELEDGESFRSHEGCTYTRYGDEMVVVTPRREARQQAA